MDRIIELANEHNWCNFSIEYNVHNINYHTVEEEFLSWYRDDWDEMSDYDKEKFRTTKTFLILQIYPRTPVAFYRIYGYSWDHVTTQLNGMIHDRAFV